MMINKLLTSFLTFSEDPRTTEFMTHMSEYGLSYGTTEEFNFRFNLY